MMNPDTAFCQGRWARALGPRSKLRIMAPVALTSVLAMLAGCTTGGDPGRASSPSSSSSTMANPQGGGEVRGAAWQHTPSSAARLVEEARVALPARVTGVDNISYGPWRALPQTQAWRRVPVVVFLHGAGGPGQRSIEEWQRWLAGLGIASVAPDSQVLPGRISYRSPVAREVYERVHALRASEIELALRAVRNAPWADPERIVLAGASEGAVAVARHDAAGVRGRMVFSWSCENNYFVAEHRTALGAQAAFLNVMSQSDLFFTTANAAVGHARPIGHCGPVMAAHKRATIVLIPGAPHALLNVPAARHAVEGLLREVLQPDLN